MNPNIEDEFEYYFVITFLVLSILAFGCYVFIIYCWTQYRDLTGNNFCSVIVFNTIIILFLPLGGCIRSLYTLYSPSPPPRIASFLTTVGSTAFRSTAISIIIERLIATYYAKNYEKSRKFQHVGLWINAFSVLLIFGISFLMIIVRIPLIGTFIIISSMSFASVFLSIFIRWKNKVLRQMTKNNPLLQHRYQLFQNIRLMKFIQPYIFLKAIVSIAGLIALYAFTFFGDNLGYSFMSLNMIYYIGTFIKTAIFIHLRKEHHKRRTRVVSCVSDSFNAFPAKDITTALGEKLPTRMTVDSYFKDLKNAWK